MAAALLVYLYGKASLAGFVLFGAWPLLLLGAAWRKASMADGAAAGLIARIAAGSALAFAPFLAYHAIHGTLGRWIDDAVLTPLHLTAILAPTAPSYLYIPLLGIGGLVQDFSLRGLASLAFWLLLLAAPVALGALTARRALGARDAQSWHPLPVVACFFALVSAHYEIPIYLFYSTGAVIMALLFAAGPRLRQAASLVAIALAAFGLAFQAGQPLSRLLTGIVRSETRALDSAATLPRASLAIEESDRRDYARILELVALHAPRCATVLALPMNAEINFLADRRSPLRFYSPALGLRSEADVERAARQLDAAPPALLVHHRRDKYNTPLSNALLARLTRDYTLRESVGGFDVYLPVAPRAAPDPGCLARGG
jgi:hypothetical protein